MDKTKLKRIITDEDGAETLVKEADILGRKFKRDGLKTTQIRAIFGEVRQIQGMWNISDNDEDNEKNTHRKKALRRFNLLKPKMAYRARKEGRKGNVVDKLVEILDPAADLVIAEKDEEKQDAKEEASIVTGFLFLENYQKYQ